MSLKKSVGEVIISFYNKHKWIVFNVIQVIILYNNLDSLKVYFSIGFLVFNLNFSKII